MPARAKWTRILCIWRLVSYVQAEADDAAHAKQCTEQLDEAVSALDKTASDVILEPYLSGVARALELIVAKMHR